ncbi:MAG: AbrB/MazE/SpoVT family DNA-binding domain-containing protein [Candidatus Chlorobium antarcticum]|jgi:putative addiction module antidote|nr:AbrB/MazE/SpoVT family DNA-binding domain-containing protein [Candidatus Chlorobium antarcticum]
MRAKVIKIVDSTGVILPKEAADRLKVKKGDTVFLNETPTGYTVTPYGPEFAAQMKAVRRATSKYRNALHELAK